MELTLKSIKGSNTINNSIPKVYFTNIYLLKIHNNMQKKKKFQIWIYTVVFTGSFHRGAVFRNLI